MRLTCDATLGSGCDNAGLVFGYLDASNYWVKVYSNTDDTIYIYEINGGTWTQRGSTAYTITDDSQFTMAAEVRAGAADTYAGTVPSGQVGIAHPRRTAAQIPNPQSPIPNPQSSTVNPPSTPPPRPLRRAACPERSRRVSPSLSPSRGRPPPTAPVFSILYSLFTTNLAQQPPPTNTDLTRAASARILRLLTQCPGPP